MCMEQSSALLEMTDPVVIQPYHQDGSLVKQVGQLRARVIDCDLGHSMQEGILLKNGVPASRDQLVASMYLCTRSCSSAICTEDHDLQLYCRGTST